VIRVTADSNIWISGFQFHGKPSQFLTLDAQRKFDLAITDHIIEEVRRTLREKFAWPEERLAHARRMMGKIGTHVEPTQTVDVIKDDPTDNRILECAAEAKSDYIETGDNDLLRIKTFGGTRILKVADFLPIIEGRGQSL
jgi:putative PIN family toxin of toxin-antitoxin system